MLANPYLRLCETIYQFFFRIGDNLQTLFLLYLRLTWGHQLFLIGLKKLGDIEGTASFFASLHLPTPLFHAYLVGFLEMSCGFLLFIGLVSRIAALPLIVIMLVALSTAHAPDLSSFRFLIEPMALVKQAPYPFLITALVVFIFGPGRLSLDAWIKRWAARQPRY